MGLWIVLQKPSTNAVDLLRERIQYYNEARGVANSDTSGYHETLTRLYIIGIHDFVTQQRLNGVELLNALLTSPIAAKSWPLRFYSRQRLRSVEARRAWVAPDLQALPNDCLG